MANVYNSEQTTLNAANTDFLVFQASASTTIVKSVVFIHADHNTTPTISLKKSGGTATVINQTTATANEGVNLLPAILPLAANDEIYVQSDHIGSADVAYVVVSYVENTTSISGQSINALVDVNTTSPAANDILRYDSTTGNWINTDILSIQAILAYQTSTFLQGLSVGNGLTVTGGAQIDTATVSGNLIVGSLLFTGNGTSTIGIFSSANEPDDLQINSNGNVTILLDVDNDETGQKFSIQDPASTERFSVDDAGAVRINDAYSLPTSDGTNNQVLATDGSGSLTFQSAASLITDSDDITEGSVNLFMTTAERSKLTGIAAGAEVNVNADWNASSGDAEILNKPTIPATFDDLGGNVTADSIVITDNGLTSAGEYATGAKILKAWSSGASLTAGSIYHFDGGSWGLADQNSSKAINLLAVCTDTTNGTLMLREGIIKVAGSFSGLTSGAPLYLGATGRVSATPSTTSGDIVRVVGYIYDVANVEVYFCPDNTWFEVE